MTKTGVIETKAGDELEAHMGSAGICTFMRTEHTKDVVGADLVVAGNPFDCATSNRPGARLGPRAMREQSMHIIAYPILYPWDYDVREECRVVDYGDAVGHRLGTGWAESMIEAQYRMAKKVFDADAGLLVLGGDHTGPYGPMRAAAEKYGPISIIHFDSHQDCTPLEDDHINHGTFAWDLAEEGVVDDSRSAQFYIRTVMGDPSYARNYNIFYANEALEMGPEALAQKVRDIVGDNPVYITFDIDGLDPSCAPGTGTPVCGGPSVLEARRVLWALKGLNVVAADLVEVAPVYDAPNQMTSVAGATLAMDMLYLMAEARKTRK